MNYAGMSLAQLLADPTIQILMWINLIGCIGATLHHLKVHWKIQEYVENRNMMKRCTDEQVLEHYKEYERYLKISKSGKTYNDSYDNAILREMKKRNLFSKFNIDKITERSSE